MIKSLYQMVTHRFGQLHRDTVADLLHPVGDGPSEFEAVRKRLETSTFSQSEWPIFSIMDEIPQCRSGDGFAGFVCREPSDAGRCSSPLLGRRSVHHAPKGTFSVTGML